MKRFPDARTPLPKAMPSRLPQVGARAVGPRCSRPHVGTGLLCRQLRRASPIVFTGDTLFTCGCGRIFEGTPAQMLASLSKLAALSARHARVLRARIHAGEFAFCVGGRAGQSGAARAAASRDGETRSRSADCPFAHRRRACDQSIPARGGACGLRGSATACGSTARGRGGRVRDAAGVEKRLLTRCSPGRRPEIAAALGLTPEAVGAYHRRSPIRRPRPNCA